MGKWHPESCKDCAHYESDLQEYGCQLGMFETVHVQDEVDHRANEMCQFPGGTFYDVASAVDPDDQGDRRYEPVIYSSMPRDRMSVIKRLSVVVLARKPKLATSDANFTALVAEHYRVPLLDDEARFDYDLDRFIGRLPKTERLVLLDRVNELDCPEAERIIELYLTSIQGEGGDKVKTLGKAADKVLNRMDEAVCMFGRHRFSGRPFYYAIDDEVLTSMHPVVEHAVPKGYQSYRVTYACGHSDDVVLKKGLHLSELNSARRSLEMVCEECHDNRMAQWAKKQSKLADL